MSTILSNQIAEDAKGAVAAYLSTASSLYLELEGVVNNLTASDFIGEGAEGYKACLNSKIKPALTENVEQLANYLNQLIDSVREALIVQADPSIGESNQNA